MSSWKVEFSDGVPVVVGRTLAACAHPVVAWRLLSASWRVLMLTTYAAASYFIVLGLLLTVGA
jgi:hypothetical protein